jgi:hypothetical protein
LLSLLLILVYCILTYAGSRLLAQGLQHRIIQHGQGETVPISVTATNQPFTLGNDIVVNVKVQYDPGKTFVWIDLESSAHNFYKPIPAPPSGAPRWPYQLNVPSGAVIDPVTHYTVIPMTLQFDTGSSGNQPGRFCIFATCSSHHDIDPNYHDRGGPAYSMLPAQVCAVSPPITTSIRLPKTAVAGEELRGTVRISRAFTEDDERHHRNFVYIATNRPAVLYGFSDKKEHGYGMRKLFIEVHKDSARFTIRSNGEAPDQSVKVVAFPVGRTAQNARVSAHVKIEQAKHHRENR